MSDASTNVCVGKPAVAPWMTAVLLSAAVYNVVWGAAVLIFPNALFDFAGIERPLYPGIWQCVGMIVGVYGVGYAIAALDPLRHWPIVLVGLLGKILGPIGFLDAALRGTLPWSFGVTIITNDLIWWVPFSIILVRAFNTRIASQTMPTNTDFNAVLREFNDQHGKSLGELSEQAPTLVVFLRHFGCTFCREALDDLQRQRDEIESANTRIALVHMSDDTLASKYIERYDLGDVSRFSDPDRKLYAAFGLQRGKLSQLFGPSVVWRGIAATLRGHSVGKLTGDGFQMPGAFIVHNRDIIRAFRHKSAGDRPQYNDLACGITSAEGSPATNLPHAGSL